MDKKQLLLERIGRLNDAILFKRNTKHMYKDGVRTTNPTAHINYAEGNRANGRTWSEVVSGNPNQSLLDRTSTNINNWTNDPEEDIVKINATAVNNATMPSQYSEPSALDQATRNWLPVIHSGSRKTKKSVVPENKLNQQLITLSNKFTPLSDVQESSIPSKTITSSETQHNKGRKNLNKESPNMLRSKIIIIGDSHARGCSQEVKHNLGHSIEVQGIVKPGANMEVIVNTSTKNIGNLTKKDMVVVWGGSQDVGRNESELGLHRLKNFIENHSHTNFIVMSVPHRHDLDPNSCINDEVMVYNRKMKKYLKACENIQIIEVDSKRELFTRHGLHMNSKGKDQIAGKIAQTIKARLNKKKSGPIILKHREDLDIYSESTERIVEVTQKEINEPQLTIEEQGTVVIVEATQIEVKEPQSTPEVQASGTQDYKLPSKRTRKPPTTRHEDFLWLDRNPKH
jgi:hypothetical protein